jgi:hypothetical protein
MLLPILALISLSSQTDQAGVGLLHMPRGPLLPRVFPNPKGANAREFYIRSVDRATHNSGIGTLSKRLLDKNRTPPTAAELKDLTACLQLIKAGTAKPVDMRPFGARLPQGAAAYEEVGGRGLLYSNGLKSITKAVASISDSSFQTNKSGQATSDLLLLLRCSHDSKGGSLILSFVGCAIDNIIYATFIRNLPHLTAQDAKQVLDSTKPLLSTTPYIKAMEAELAFTVVSTRATMQELDKELRRPSAPSNDPEMQKVVAQFKKLSPAQRAEYSRRAGQDIPRLMRPRIQQLSLPEYRWNFKDTGPPSYRKDPLQALLMATSGADLFSQTLVVFAKNRTQMRLLRLHVLLESYKKRHGVFPKNLTQLSGVGDIYDPLSNKPFQYRVSPTGYRLYSEGVPQTGVVEMSLPLKR